MGAIRWHVRPRDWDEDVRSLGAAEGASGEVRLRPGAGRGGCQGAAGQAVSDGAEEGSSSPLGATPSPNGVNFSVFSKHATRVELLLFDRVDDTKAARVVRPEPTAH